MKRHLKRVSFLLTALLVAGSGAKAVPENAGTASFSNNTSRTVPLSTATLKEAHGTVFKAQLIDQATSEFGKPEPAGKNDILAEGTVVGTGKNSWAQLEWPTVVTRIWANSVVQVRPSARQVYLQEGAVLFRLDKNRPDKTTVYDVRTKLLQARIHGTTVKVESTPFVNRIAVLEGNIDVVNLQNKSVVHLTPGVVLEVKVEGALKGARPDVQIFKNIPGFEDLKSEAKPDQQPNNISSTDNRFNPNKSELIFKDKYTRTVAYAINSKAVLDDPMVKSMPDAIDSTPLIKDALAKAPGYSLPEFMADAANAKGIDKFVSKNLRIVAVPSRTSYFIGPNVGEALPLPSIAYTELPPAGRLGDVNTNVTASLQARPMTMPNPIMLPGMAPPPGSETVTASVTNATQNVAPIASQITQVSQPQAVIQPVVPVQVPVHVPMPMQMQQQQPTPVVIQPVITPVAPLVSPVTQPVQQVQQQLNNKISDSSSSSLLQSISNNNVNIPGRSN